MTETPDERVRRLKPIAQQLVGRIHDDDPEANLRWLRAMLGQHWGPVTDTEVLLFMVGAAVPTDEKFSALVAWTGEPTPAEDRLERRRQTWRESKRRSVERQREAQNRPQVSTGLSTGDVADEGRSRHTSGSSCGQEDAA